MNLLDITDLGHDAVRTILDLARRPVASLSRPLDGRGVALIFEKPSNRTRHSMEIAVVELGGHPVYTRGEEVGFDTREPVEDIGRILSGYHAVVAARVFSHSVVERLAAVCDVPVVNMLSDRSHPLQALADALTMVEEFGTLDGRTVAWVGDYNNVARSLGEICSMLGAHLSFAGPSGYQVSDSELERFVRLGARSVRSSEDPRDAVDGAHAVHTDTWVSMGQEAEKAERIQIFGDYTVTGELMARAADGAIFMHCLPAYRGLEVESAVIDGPSSRVIRQGHNRLHSARGALAYLMEVK
ncbi:MAG: ornithine carbamoyltransferase [Actinomycetota bacterium]|jgi:ornithine carbamoyltransferase